MSPLVPVGIGSYAIPNSAMVQNDAWLGKRGDLEGPSLARLNSLSYYAANIRDGSAFRGEM